MKVSKDSPSPKFETVMENLQNIVREMESGDLPLDDLIGKYEEGMKLVKISRDKLAQAEQKIEILTKTQEANPGAADLTEESSAQSKAREEINLF